MSNAAGTHDHNEIYTIAVAGGKPTRRDGLDDRRDPARLDAGREGASSYSLDGAIWR